MTEKKLKRDPVSTKPVSVKPVSVKVLHDHIVSRVCRLADAMVRMSSKHFQELWSLRNTDLRLLNVLEGGKALSVNEIARRALLDQAWVSRSIKALEAAKVLARGCDPKDSRLILISLTRRGREILEEFRPYAEWSERVLLRSVDEEKLKQLLDQLEANTQGLMDTLAGYPSKPRKSKPLKE